MRASALRVLGVSAGVMLLCWVACAPRVEHCWVCQREIDSRVRATITMADGKQVHSCCPRCALHYREDPGNSVQKIAVTDYATGASLPLALAFLVEGSDETPCLHHHAVMSEREAPMQLCFDRCMPSLIAFRDAEAARSFMADHGGTLLAPGTLPQSPSSTH